MSRKKNNEKKTEKETNHWMVWHGVLGNEDWELPQCVARTTKVNRKDQGNHTNASEYLDHPDVLDQKMKNVADLVKKSKCMITYTGAGISRGAGIPDYGTKAKESVMNQYQKLKRPSYALPTYSHYCLANLEEEGYLKYYVQQNHDGLPQKAGFPQEKLNEIHGAWFDVSNPVVQFSGSLRGDLFREMLCFEERADLCLCMGTSLSGMNADRCVTTPAEKFAGQEEGALGSVIVNLQKTPVDLPGYITIRIWAKIDDAMALLMKHLGMEMRKKKVEVVKSHRVVCPYNEKGMFDESKKMILDLSKGQKIRIINPKASNKVKVGMVTHYDPFGHYLITFDRVRRMGKWWLPLIRDGKVQQIPIINENPKFLEG